MILTAYTRGVNGIVLNTLYDAHVLYRNRVWYQLHSLPGHQHWCVFDCNV